MITGDKRGGSLGPTIWLFISCLFYLLPVIWLEPYIGGWAWLAGIGFWAVVVTVLALIARYCTRRCQ